MAATDHDLDAAELRGEPSEDSIVNLQRLSDALNSAGVAGVVATSPENVMYLTGFKHWPLSVGRESGAFAVVRSDGKRALIAPLSGAEYLAAHPAEDCLLYTYADYFVIRGPDAPLEDLDRALLAIHDRASHFKEPLAAIGQALVDLDLRSTRVALDGDGVGSARRAQLVEAVRSDSEDGSELLRTVRRVKTSAELVHLQRCVLATENAMVFMLRGAALGESELDLVRRFEMGCVAQGIAPGHCETNVGPRAGGCYPADRENVVRRGVAIRCDCGGRDEGYWADTGRNGFVGDVPDEISAALTAIQAGMNVLSGLVKPGAEVSELARAGIEAVRDAGLPDYNRHHVGHGIGLEMYEPPILRPTPGAETNVLIEGEVLNVELPYYGIGVGGLQLEDTLVVTADGSRFITTAPHEPFQVL